MENNNFDKLRQRKAVWRKLTSQLRASQQLEIINKYENEKVFAVEQEGVRVTVNAVDVYYMGTLDDANMVVEFLNFIKEENK